MRFVSQMTLLPAEASRVTMTRVFQQPARGLPCRLPLFVFFSFRLIIWIILFFRGGEEGICDYSVPCSWGFPFSWRSVA